MTGSCALLMVFAVVHAAALPPWIPSASDGSNAWVAVERAGRSGPEAVLLHHADGMGLDRAREAFVLPMPPEAMAASGGTLWVVLPARDSGRRETYSVRTERHAASGAWISIPGGRMDIHAALPDGTTVVAMAADADGPIVQRADGGLLRLAGDAWVAEPGITAAPTARLCTVAGRPALADPATRSLVMRDRSGSWTASAVVVPGDGLARVVAGTQSPVAIVERDGEVRLAHLRPGTPAELEPFSHEPRPLAIVGCGPRILVFTGTGTGGAAIAEVDPLTGRVGEPAITRPPDSAGGRIATMVVVLAATGAALATFAVRRVARLKPASGERR
jgi:hypothetical protein